MSINPANVRAGIETRLATISGLQTRDRMPEMIDPPVGICWPTSADYDTSMGRGTDRYVFNVTVFVCRADSEEAQTKLDGYLNATGSTSVKTAVEGDRTLGGTVDTCRVTGVTDIGVAEVADIPYLFAEFQLETFG